jgi:hypothetical protein
MAKDQHLKPEQMVTLFRQLMSFQQMAKLWLKFVKKWVRSSKAIIVSVRSMTGSS